MYGRRVFMCALPVSDIAWYSPRSLVLLNCCIIQYHRPYYFSLRVENLHFARDCYIMYLQQPPAVLERRFPYFTGLWAVPTEQ